jgi:hypothetical protein
MIDRSGGLLCAALAALALSACGGGTDGTGAVPESAVTSSGVMTKGSVIVNGVRFDDAAAVVSDDRGRAAASLADGLVIRLRGRTDGGGNGTAERIDVENEVRGPVQSVDSAADPRQFVVAGLVILVDDATVFAGVPGFASLAPGLRVEVSGLRDANGLLRASRVEAVAAADGLDERRGVIGSVDTAADRFTLDGGIVVDYAAATIRPAGTGETALAAGAVVEVRGRLAGGVLSAAEVDVEALEDRVFQGEPNEKQQVEGFVSGFTVHPGSFFVNGRRVTTLASTVFAAGGPADLADNVPVVADGVIDVQGVLVATKIRFAKTRQILHGRVTALDAAQRTLVVLGQTVRANDLTRIDARPAVPGAPTDRLEDITPGTDCVETWGTAGGSVLLADWIREVSVCSRDLVQARVTAKDATAFTLTFLGGLVASMPATAQYRDAGEVPMSREAFFAAVSAGAAATLVRVRGTYDGTRLVAEEAELKNE